MAGQEPALLLGCGPAGRPHLPCGCRHGEHNHKQANWRMGGAGHMYVAYSKSWFDHRGLDSLREDGGSTTSYPVDQFTLSAICRSAPCICAMTTKTRFRSGLISNPGAPVKTGQGRDAIRVVFCDLKE